MIKVHAQMLSPKQTAKYAPGVFSPITICVSNLLEMYRVVCAWTISCAGEFNNAFDLSSREGGTQTQTQVPMADYTPFSKLRMYGIRRH